MLMLFDQRTVADGDMTAADVACLFCETIGGIELFFNHQEITIKAGHLLKLADLRSGRVLAAATCTACRCEIPQRKWPAALAALLNENKCLYKGKFRFRIGKVFAALNLALAGWLAYIILAPQYGSLESHGADAQRIVRAMRHMTPGTVFLIDAPSRDALLGKSSPLPTPAVYMLVRVEAAEGDRVTLRLHKTSWTENPLSYGLYDTDGTVRNAAPPENFSVDEITVTRDLAHNDFLRSTGAYPLIVRSVVAE